MTRFSIAPSLRTWAEIDVSAVCDNVRVVRRLIGEKPRILAVVKANAYGHGAVEVARAVAGQVDIFGVANVCEAREIFDANTGRDVMILSPCLPDEREVAVAAGAIVTVSSATEAAAYAEHGRVRVNFKIDTGMGRVGAWWERAEAELEAVSRVPGLAIHSVSTHLPVSDEDEAFTRRQLAHFEELAARIRRMAPGALIHSLNSAGILRFPEFANDLVRAGLVLYGESPVPEFQSMLTRPLVWKTRLALVQDLPTGASVSYGRTFVAERPMRVALLPIGYADGFPRALSGRGAHVLINGARCAILGRVTMDQVVVDVSGEDGVKTGDEVVIIGRQGDAEITAGELAAQAATIPWDIFTGIKSRVVRIHGGT